MEDLEDRLLFSFHLGKMRGIPIQFRKYVNWLKQILNFYPASVVEAQKINTSLKEIEKENIFFDTSLVLGSFSVANTISSEIF